METILKPGSRIICDGEFGTVLFIGELENIEGTWLGVEWDEASSNKHNGYLNGTYYFKTSIPNTGSFIKLSDAKIGISCPEAVKQKYGDSWDADDFISFPQLGGRNKQVEMVGMKKISKKRSNFSRLTEIVLSNMEINGPGEKNELKEMIPNVKDLDLSMNLLNSWEDIAFIAEQLPCLQTLRLSKNKLKISGEGEKFQDNFSHLKELILNKMAYTWKEVLLCALMWPYVEKLYLQYNKIFCLEEPFYPIFCRLRVLNLDNNPLKYWKEICHLGRLSNLEELYLDNVLLESIIFPDVPPLEKTDLFQNLKLISIKDNHLQQWRDISELNKLVKLKELMVNNNPIIQSVNHALARHLVIAKIIGLEKLNRSEIGKAERRGAEIDYLKQYHRDWIMSGRQLDFGISKSSESFFSEHPTYLNFIKKYGIIEEAELNQQTSLLKNKLISLKIISPMMPERKPIFKKLPADMTIGKLRGIVQRLFKISYPSITLTYYVEGDENRKLMLDNDLRDLSFYSLSDKNIISVEW